VSLDASYSYLDFEYTRLSPEASASGIGMDMVTPFTPKHTASVGLQYDYPLSGGGLLTMRLDGIHRSAVFNEPTNAYFNYLESRNIYNARVAYRSPSEDWETSVAVLNLTDEIFYHSIFGRGADRASGMPDRGRQWLVSLRRTF
jgi:iron complex outermembrane receptor protein